MLTLGAISFVAPWALAALAVLPALWWLVRITPPVPRRVAFPSLMLLAMLRSSEDSAARTPPWLVLLRLLLAAAVILGAAHPLLNAPEALPGRGPVVVMVDDGWPAAGDWTARRTAMAELIDQADREGRGVVLMTSAPVADGEPAPPVEVLTTEEARQRAAALAPKPWPTDRAAAVNRLSAAVAAGVVDTATVVWLSDGLAEPAPDKSFPDLVASLRSLGPTVVVKPEAGRVTVALLPPQADGTALRLAALRPESGPVPPLAVRALGEDGALLSRVPLTFADDGRRGEVRLEMPSELRNQLARLEVEGVSSAGAVVLIDERWRRRPVGVVTPPQSGIHPPLLRGAYYVQRALEPGTEVRRGTVRDLLSRPLAMLVVADETPLDAADRAAIGAWVADGGLLLRFADPELARSAGTDDLLPVRLCGGDRVLGGALSWRTPAALAPFPDGGPLNGLAVPEDVSVRRQVLAEPSIDLAERTWARLDDGTPLITGAARGDGWLVLVHTTAGPEWTDLPLSGLFVEILERLVALGRGAVAGVDGGQPLVPVDALDAYGRLGTPPPGAHAIPADAIAEAVVGPGHPPGIYGRGPVRRALNLTAGMDDLRPLGSLPTGVEQSAYGVAEARDLRPWLLGAAMLLVLVDMAVSLAMRGALSLAWRPWRRRSVTSAVLAPLMLTWAVLAPVGTAAAQEYVSTGTAEAAALTTRLAYVITGDPEVDAVSRAGLAGLTAMVNRRTATELDAPVGLDPARDELLFYPLIYWPLVGTATAPAEEAVRRLEAYMRGGGTILFDTRARGGGERPRGLNVLAEALSIPPLVPVPRDHVLGRAFYLLPSFPGRWTGGTVWIEAAGERINDGVTSVIVGSHDWAGAWATDDAQRPLFAAVPGGKRQRELAYRFGINLVMHVLTGSYKNDQVHMPAILERLGR